MVTAGLIMMIVSLVSMVAWYIVDIGLETLLWLSNGQMISNAWISISFALHLAGWVVLLQARSI